MANWKKLAQGAAGAAGGGAALNVEDVFSTYLYAGNSSSQSISNGIDLSTEGGMVWLKSRTVARSHFIADTERGSSKTLSSESSASETTDTTRYTSFNTDGFSVGGSSNTNNSGENFASWTFRKAPKFFDVVTYTGDGTTNHTVSHSLNSEVGFLVVKSLSSGSWYAYHRGANGGTNPNQYVLFFNGTNAEANFNYFDVTTTSFTLKNANANVSGQNYVAYLFAHNDGDGNFGPTKDRNIIRCGSYTGTGNTDGPDVDLGFEPQWLLIKKTDSATANGDWQLYDAMRGLANTSNGLAILEPNNSASENIIDGTIKLNANGFKPVDSNFRVNASGSNYVYVAIRRGPMALLEDANDAFNVASHLTDNSGKIQPSGFVTDLALTTNPNSSNDNWIMARLQNGQVLRTNLTNPIVNFPAYLKFDQQDGIKTIYFWGATSAPKWWQFARREGFLDVVTYNGNGTTTWRNHNLGVVPEMMWIKSQNSSEDWVVYHKNRSSASKILTLNGNGGEQTVLSPYDVPSTPTSTQFQVGTNSRVNSSGNYYINFLFASLDGVSKVGSYTGTGSSQNIDCGFSNGSQFVIIKRLNNFGGWFCFDSLRGISGNTDSALDLGSNATQIYNSNIDIEPYSGGFAVDGSDAQFNASGSTYIFWAIAA